MNNIASHKVVMVDCDDTLILWNASENRSLPEVEIPYAGHISKVNINTKNCNLVKKLAKLGYTIIVWSGTGYDWAYQVVHSLGLNDYVTLCMSKPRYYVDDQDPSQWLMQRLYRDPKTGKSLEDK